MGETGEQASLRLLRVDFSEHREEDKQNFGKLEASVNQINVTLATWLGAARMSKWALGLGMPAIFGAVVTHVARHW